MKRECFFYLFLLNEKVDYYLVRLVYAGQERTAQVIKKTPLGMSGVFCISVLFVDGLKQIAYR
jgi:hypothetical protein